MLINTLHNATYSTQNTPRCVVATPSFLDSVDKPSTHEASFTMAYVYRHIRLDKSEPFYIGIGADDKYKRAYDKSKGRRSEAWFRIINKAEYEVDILIDDIDIELAKEKEIEFIKLYGRRDLRTGTLVNMTDGGDGLNNRVFTHEYRKKLSEAAKKRLPQPQLQKIIDYRKNHFQFTDEIRKKISDAHKGKSLPQSTLDKLKERVGAKNPMYGKSNYNFKGYILVFKDGNQAGEYRGVHICAKELNVTASKISACLTGRRKTTGGYSFKRIFKGKVL
jgi:hypothetical protein